jgi:ankyrin repeat protein
MKRMLFVILVVTAVLLYFHSASERTTNAQETSESINSRHSTASAVFREVNPGNALQPITDDQLLRASEKAIRLMQHAQVVWYKKETCTSCHHQLLPEIALALARDRGVPFDEETARVTTAASFAYLNNLDAAVQGYDFIDVLFDGWALTAAGIADVKPSLATSAYSQFIASQQLPDGSWSTTDARPPQAHGHFSVTALCCKAIRDYMPAEHRAERDSRLLRARNWMLKTQPRTNEDRTFRLLGLHWTGATKAATQRVARQLLAEQRADGGWSQLPSLESDAYSTGEALFALSECRALATTDPAYRQGIRFLLQNQERDGSWQIKSRLHPPAPVSPPYVDTEFPYQHDQFISMMGTSWATAALLMALPTKGRVADEQAGLTNIAHTHQPDWAETALNGSAVQLKRLLDGGMEANNKTEEGTSVLMLAARDFEKVKLLVERGANVNARASTGMTALIVAARYRGNSRVVRFLLENGAKIDLDQNLEIRNDASALFFSVMAADAETLKALLGAGAKVEARMKLLGLVAVSPLLYATTSGDSEIVELLIDHGADPNEVDGDGISALDWATLANHVETVKLLLKKGARVDHVDKFAMTPLLYAASIDFGDTAVLEKLIDAGADLKARSKQGLTALELANAYHHSLLAKTLARKKR